jgi:hypothetical protein
MTGRTTAISGSSAATKSDAWSGVRRWIALHRRVVSAALAFVAVLLGLTALTTTPAQPSSPDGWGAAAAQPTLSDGQLAVPVRLADPAVAEMLAPGDVVDVIVADQRNVATLVAASLTVTAVPEAESGGPWADGDGLVMVAATDDEALAIAGAAARGPVTVAVHP